MQSAAKDLPASREAEPPRPEAVPLTPVTSDIRSGESVGSAGELNRTEDYENDDENGDDADENGSNSTDSEEDIDRKMQPEATMLVGCWNIQGLASYKRKMLLGYAASEKLDVLAVCETHLWNSEQLVCWEQVVDLPDSEFIWFGRPALRIDRLHESGRASGGVGLMIRRDWEEYCTPLTQCRHPSLLFVRLDLPDAPFPIFVGVAYLVPVGSARAASNVDLLDELGELSVQFQQLGMVLVLGDFNTHIACIPSVVRDLAGAVDGIARVGMESDEFSQLGAGEPVTLERNSVDVPEGARADQVPARGAVFMERMDAVGLVVLNGLAAVGSGARAEATFGVRSVIDLILVDANHWQLMDSVSVRRGARAVVQSDHELITTTLRCDPELHDRVRFGPHGVAQEASDPVVENVSVFINKTRYITSTRGNPQHFDEYAQKCAEVLPDLVRSWSERKGSERGIGVETVWSEFTTALGDVCKTTLGVRRERCLKGGSIRRAFHVTRDWIKRRREIWKKIHQLLPSERQLRRELEEELRPLNSRIRYRMRNEFRVQQQRAVDRVLRLRRSQMREHWHELKRIGNLLPKVRSAPSTALDSTGVEHSEPSEVRLHWREAWAKLATHTADDPRYDIQFHDQVEEKHIRDPEEKIEEEVIAGDLDRERSVAAAASLNTSINLGEVMDSLRKLRRGKAAGSDGISAEVLRSGGDEMVKCIHFICQHMFSSSEVPLDWLRGVVVPIYKDGDKRDPLNYRPITLLSIVGKAYTNILCGRLTEWAEQLGIIVQEQGGFRAHRGCAEQLFALTELVNMRRRARLSTFACFVDIKKAYDTVWHSGLKEKLRRYGIHGRMYRAVCSLYAGCESTIYLGTALGYTDFFPIQTGVRQGCILSPLLYSLFINGAAEGIKATHSHHGVLVGAGPRPLAVVGPAAGRITLLLYADDIVLLSESEEGLQALMSALHSYSLLWRFDFNHAKCGLMRFCAVGDVLPTSDLRLGDHPVAWVHVYKYLGVELHNGRAFTQYRQRALTLARRAADAVSGLGMYSGKLGVPLSIQVYKAMVRPLMEYCSEIWSVSPWEAAEKLQIMMAKRILGVSIRCSSEAARGELGWMKMDARWQKARVIFWGKLQTMARDSPARMVYEASAAAFAVSEAAARL